MAEDALAKALQKRRQITISVTGRRTGRTISLPVWFVSERDTLWLLPVHGSHTHWYRNLLSNPTIKIKVEKEQRTFRARTLQGVRSVRQVIGRFRDKYTADVITRLYPGPLNVAVKVHISG